MKRRKNTKYHKKAPSNEMLSERIRLCERDLDNIEDDKRDFNKKLTAIVIFSLTLLAFILNLDFATYEKEMNNPLYADYKEIMVKAWRLKVSFEFYAYICLVIALLVAMAGHFPITVHILDITAHEYKKHYSIKFFKKYIAERYEEGNCC